MNKHMPAQTDLQVTTLNIHSEAVDQEVDCIPHYKGGQGKNPSKNVVQRENLLYSTTGISSTYGE